MGVESAKNPDEPTLLDEPNNTKIVETITNHQLTKVIELEIMEVNLESQGEQIKDKEEEQ